MTKREIWFIILTQFGMWVAINSLFVGLILWTAAITGNVVMGIVLSCISIIFVTVIQILTLYCDLLD